MELLPLLRWVWRRRFVLVGAVVVAVAAFVALGGNRSSGATRAVAWTQVMLDTPRSELAAAGPAGADTLSWRTSLLMHLIATDESTRELAHRAGVTQNELAVIDSSFTAPIIQTSTAVAVAKAASLAATPYALDVFLTDPTLPLISIEADAFDRSGAERLATAAVVILKSQGSPGGRFSSLIPTDSGGRTLQPFVVHQVAPVRVMVFPVSALSLKALVGALFVFLLCCVVGSRLVPRSRPGVTHVPARSPPNPLRSGRTAS
jgi:hypothetical protein